MMRDQCQRLSPLVEELSDVIGLKATLKLLEAKGGQRVAVPTKLKNKHWLVNLLGYDTALKLCHHITHDQRVHLDIPFGPRSSASRYSATKKMLENGASANQIANELKIHRRTVFYQKAKIEKESGKINNQPNLFECFGVVVK